MHGGKADAQTIWVGTVYQNFFQVINYTLCPHILVLVNFLDFTQLWTVSATSCWVKKTLKLIEVDTAFSGLEDEGMSLQSLSTFLNINERYAIPRVFKVTRFQFLNLISSFHSFRLHMTETHR